MQDIERGEVYPAVGISSLNHSQSVSISVSSSPSRSIPDSSSASLHGSTIRCDSGAPTGVGHEVNVPSTVQDTRNACASTNVNIGQTANRNRWKIVGSVLKRLIVVMVFLILLTGALALTVFYMGPIYLVQLLVVISVAYFVAGGRLKWFYIALRTAPRDIK